MAGTRQRRLGPSTTRFLRALGGLVILVIVLAGLPLALFLVAGNPIPASVPTLDQIADVATRRDLDGSFFRTTVAYLGWLGWSSFAVSVLLETVSAVSGRRMPSIRGLRTQRRAAAALIGLVFAAAGPGTVAVADVGAGQSAAAVSGAVESGDDTVSPAQQTQQPAPYTVLPGDSLWRIAEQHLGDGALWPELAEHNYGKPQPGAARGLDDTHVIRPGWVLEIPPVGVNVEPDGDGDGTGAHVVVPGDSLWNIAEDHLEPPATDAEIAAEWPRWYDTNREVIGDDPDLIIPGQRLVDPDSVGDGAQGSDDASSGVTDDPATGTTTSEPGTASPSPAENGGAGAHPITPEARPSESPGQLAEPAEAPLPVLPDITGSPTPAAAAGDDADDESGTISQGLPARTVAGIGALLAAALTAVIAIGRRRQRAKRKRGDELPAPTGRAAAIEQELWNIADPVGAQLLDRALRNLAGNISPLPQVRAARLTPDAVELYLATPAQLPDPWRSKANATVWALPADLVQNVDRDDSDVPGPYPCLVTTGHDEEGGHVLIDLEQVRALGIDGPAEQAQQIITALAVELACSPLADDLTVWVVGACREIGDVLGTGRLQHVEDLDNLLDTFETHAHRDRDALRRLGVTTAAQARSNAGEWAPEVLLIAQPLTEGRRRRLADVLHGDPRPAIAAVTTGTDGLTDWVLRCPDEQSPESWVLEPVGLDVDPQRITAADYDNIVDILRTADRMPAPAHSPGATDHSGPVARPGSVADPGPAETAINGGPVMTVGAATEDASDPDLGPVVRVLGPVTLEGARGRVDRSHIGQLTEIAAYIALHPGTTSEDLDNAIWPGEPHKQASRAQACSRLRNWLGSDDHGHRYFPQMTDGHYRFSPAVHTDWDLFCTHVPTDPTTLPTDHLEAALNLVTGQPFTGTTGRRPKYRWADRLKSQMIIAITDTATTIAERALTTGQPSRARAAATTGLQAEPGMEQLWRLLLQAEHHAGNPKGLHTAIHQLHQQLEHLGTDPEPETTHLIHQLQSTRPHHSTS